MALSYKFVLPPTGAAENYVVKEMFQDVSSYFSTIDSTYVHTTGNESIAGIKTLTGSSLQISPSSGDAYIGFNISGGANWTIGADDSDSDTFVISNSTSLGSNNAIKIKTSNAGVAILGTNTNDDAATGYVGESARAIQTTFTNATTSTQFADVVSISLTAGDWLVTGLLVWQLNGATATQVGGVISLFSGNTTTDHVYGDNLAFTGPPTANYDSNVVITDWRVKLTSTTTVYLKARSDFSAGTPQHKGRVSAIRIR